MHSEFGGLEYWAVSNFTFAILSTLCIVHIPVKDYMNRYVPYLLVTNW